MLIIRQEQISALMDRKAKRFVMAITEHLRSEFPSRCEQLGSDGLDAEIQYGLKAALGFGFQSENAVCRFMNLQMVLGRDFYEREENRWMQPWLDPGDEMSPGSRLQYIYAKVIARLQAVEKKTAGSASDTHTPA